MNRCISVLSVTAALMVVVIRKIIFIVYSVALPQDLPSFMWGYMKLLSLSLSEKAPVEIPH